MGLIVLPVRDQADIGQVRRAVQGVAQANGFAPSNVAELAIVAAELATNLVRHQTVNGEIRIAALDGASGKGIEVVSIDDGPGIGDVTGAVQDHCSTIGTIGCGLGAVRRLTDEFDIRSDPPLWHSGRGRQVSPACGTIVATRKWARSRTGASPQFSVSAISRPCQGETANGDGFLVREDDAGLLIAVADALGHGELAAEASERTIKCIEEQDTWAPDEVFSQVHSALRNCRGTVLALIRIDLRLGRLHYAAVGNVECRGYARRFPTLLPQRGIVGVGVLPQLRVTEVPWPAQATLIVHTDGIATGWSLNEALESPQYHVATLGHSIMRGFARAHDDATLVVARENAP